MITYENMKERWRRLYYLVADDPNRVHSPEFKHAVALFDRDFQTLARIDPHGFAALKMEVDTLTVPVPFREIG